MIKAVLRSKGRDTILNKLGKLEDVLKEHSFQLLVLYVKGEELKDLMDVLAANYTRIDTHSAIRILFVKNDIRIQVETIDYYV